MSLRRLEEKTPSSQPTDRAAAHLKDLIAAGKLFDCSKLASWSASSAKYGSGIANLMKSGVCWQSDGIAPHTITLHFRKLMPIAAVQVTVCAQDETYTPYKVEVRGTTFISANSVDGGGPLDDDSGYKVGARCDIDFDTVTIFCTSNTGWDDSESEDELDERRGKKMARNEWDCFLWCTTLQFRVLENQSGGRDSRIWGLKVFAAREENEDTMYYCGTK